MTTIEAQPRTGGTYAIYNSAAGKRYVGSSLDVRERLQTHRRALERGTHQNRHLQAAWNKYGHAAFRFYAITPMAGATSAEIRAAEQAFLDMCWPYLYNMGHVATAPMTGITHSPERRARISQANKGQKRSVEARARMSRAMMGKNLGRVQSKAERAARSAALSATWLTLSPAERQAWGDSIRASVRRRWPR